MSKPSVKIKQQEIEKAYRAIMGGGLAIIPSRVGYTLFGNSEKAIKKMFEIKGRPLSKPCIVLTKREFLEEIAEVPEKYLKFIDAIEGEGLLCGFILKRLPHPHFELQHPYVRDYSKRPDGTSCFVINASDYAKYMVDRSITDKTFIVGSSANKSGTGNEGYFASIPENIRNLVDYAIEHDEYVQQEYNPQTREQGVMVDLTGKVPVITRKGLKYSRITELLKTHFGDFEVLESAERPSSS